MDYPYKCKFKDNCYVSFEKGKYDLWHVIYIENNSKENITDENWMSYLREHSELYNSENLFNAICEIGKLIPMTEPKPSCESIQSIKEIIFDYQLDKIDRFIFIFYYLMIAECYYPHTKLRYKIKLVALHQTLFTTNKIESICYSLGSKTHKNQRAAVGKEVYQATKRYLEKNHIEIS